MNHGYFHAHALPVVTYHDIDRSFLRSLKSLSLVELRTLKARLEREWGPEWKEIAVRRALKRRQT